MYSPPDSFIDFDSDAEEAPPTGRWRALEVKGYGELTARKPQPAAVSMLAAAVNSKASAEFRHEVLVLFVKTHVSEADFEEIMRRMVMGETEAGFSIGAVAEQIATWGTARPTLPS